MFLLVLVSGVGGVGGTFSDTVQRATIFGMTTVDTYAKLQLHYWPRTTYVYTYGKNL